MAKAKLNMDILAAVVAAGPNGTFGPLNEAQAFAEAGFMEINESVTDADGNVAVRATLAGVEEVGGAEKFSVLCTPCYGQRMGFLD